MQKVPVIIIPVTYANKFMYQRSAFFVFQQKQIL